MAIARAVRSSLMLSSFAGPCRSICRDETRFLEYLTMVPRVIELLLGDSGTQIGNRFARIEQLKCIVTWSQDSRRAPATDPP